MSSRSTRSSSNSPHQWATDGWARIAVRAGASSGRTGRMVTAGAAMLMARQRTASVQVADGFGRILPVTRWPRMSVAKAQIRHEASITGVGHARSSQICYSREHWLLLAVPKSQPKVPTEGPAARNPVVGYDRSVTGPQRRPRSSASITDAPGTPPGPPHRFRPQKRACDAEQHRVAAQAQDRLRRARKKRRTNRHDVPHCDRDVRRSRQFHASIAPSRDRRPHGRWPSLLPHQRLRELPRSRSVDRDRDMPRLRGHAAPARPPSVPLTLIP